MLTDYHVHLRPDGRDNRPDRFFTAANAERYRDTASERGIAELGVAEHVYRFTAALDVSGDVLAQATDDAWLVERTGGTVRVVESTPANLKVTTPHDLAIAEHLLADRLSRPPAP